MTDAENLDALHAAAAQVAGELGLANIPKSNWTIEQRKAYVDAFRLLILANQEQFTPQTVATANAINTSGYYIDYGANFEIAVSDAVLGAAASVSAPMSAANGIIDALNGVGQGLSVVGKLAPLIIPLAVVLGLIIASKSGAARLERAASF